jgi:copper chaperone NosL
MNMANFKKTGLLSCVFLASLLFSAGCGKTPVMPENIGSDDVCYFCKSPIIEPDFAAEYLTTSGSVYKFDDMACLIGSARVTGKDKIKSIYVMDADAKTWVPAGQVQFVSSDKIRTPKSGGLVAFKYAAKARDLASRYQADLVKLEDLLK